MKKYIFIGIIIGLLASLGQAIYAQSAAFYSVDVGSGPANGEVLMTNGTVSTWVSTSSLGIVSGGGSGTVTSVAQTVPTGFTISGSPVTTSGTLAISYDTGYEGFKTASSTQYNAAYASTTALTPAYLRGLFSNTATGLTYNSSTGATSLTANYVIPLIASTTQWAAAHASTTALTPAYIRGLFSGTSPITFNSGTGAIGFDFSTNNTWTGRNIFDNASSTNFTVSNILYMPGVSNGCATFSGGIATSTGTACGSGGSGNSAFTIGNGVIYNATSTDNVGIGSTTPNAKLTVRGSAGSLNDVFIVATSTNATTLVVKSSGFVGIATSSPSHTLTVGGDVNITGALRFNGLAGTQGNILMSNGSGSPTWIATSSLGIPKRSGVSIASSTWTGSSSVPMGTAYGTQTYVNARCWTDTGTANAVISDGTNLSSTVSITSTPANVTFTAGNVFTNLEKKITIFGTPTGGATEATCTYEYYE